MRTYTWTVDGNEKKLEIHPNFVVFGNTVFMDGEYKLIERTPNNQLLFRDSQTESPKFEIPFETETQAKEALDLLLRIWYPADFEDEAEEEQPKELTPKQIAEVRFLVHEELEAIGEECRRAVRGACRNTCGRVADFTQHLVARGFYHATQAGVAVWNGVEAWWHGPEAAFAREHAD